MKTALVTGANRGIGYEVVRELADAGFRVFLAARNLGDGARAANTLAQHQPGVTFLELDVTSDDSAARAADAVGREVDHLDVLVNNAGVVLDADRPFLEHAADLVR